MMKVLTSGHTARDHRFAYSSNKPAKLSHSNGDSAVEVTVRDISASGVALNVETPYENGAFVQVHIEGMGKIRGNVIRAYEGGVAVRFQNRQDESKLATLNSLA